jgi:hypothetical protein
LSGAAAFPPSESAPGLTSRASDTTGKAFMTQPCQFENNGLAPLFRTFSGCTVRRSATSVEPSKTSRIFSQSKQRNSPLVPGRVINSMRR